MFREVFNVKAENLLILTPEEKSDPNNSSVPLRWVLPQHVVILGVILLNTTDLIYKGGVFLKSLITWTLHVLLIITQQQFVFNLQ